MNLFKAILAALAPGPAAQDQGVRQPVAGLCADLDCAAHYGFAASVDAPHDEAYRARFNTTLDAWLAAHPAAASAGARGEPAWRQAVADRMEALGAPVTQAGRLPQTDPDRASRLAVAFTLIWDGVRACDARYGHAPLPAPFTWID